MAKPLKKIVSDPSFKELVIAVMRLAKCSKEI